MWDRRWSRDPSFAKASDSAKASSDRSAGKPAAVEASSAKPATVDDNDGDTLSLAQAIANAASITPKDPITALDKPVATVSKPAARTNQPAAQQPPAAPQSAAAAPQSAPMTPQTFSTEVPGTGQKQYTGHPINYDF